MNRLILKHWTVCLALVCAAPTTAVACGEVHLLTSPATPPTRTVDVRVLNDGRLLFHEITDPPRIEAHRRFTGADWTQHGRAYVRETLQRLIAGLRPGQELRVHHDRRDILFVHYFEHLGGASIHVVELPRRQEYKPLIDALRARGVTTLSVGGVYKTGAKIPADAVNLATDVLTPALQSIFNLPK